ncbi:hypothetical protein [Faecalibacterium sp. PGM34]
MANSRLQQRCATAAFSFQQPALRSYAFFKQQAQQKMQQIRFCIHYYYNPIAGGIQSVLSILHEKNSIFCSKG